MYFVNLKSAVSFTSFNKAQGRGRYILFEAGMRDRALALLTLEADLRVAVEQAQLEVHYQPILRTPTGETAGLEALVRWQHPKHGCISPADFIPLAEETGLIADIDRWVLRQACKQVVLWGAEIFGQGGLTVSVNVSSRHFVRTDFVDYVGSVLLETGLQPGQLKLELTESVFMSLSEPVDAALNGLRALGVQLHIDDFGTGYSSLSYLQRLSANTLKIDRSFVNKMVTYPASAELVRTIIGMAHNLGMQVVAEGVETEEQLRQLAAWGCEYVQGYLFARPLPVASVPSFLQARAAAPVANVPGKVRASPKRAVACTKSRV